MESYAPSCCWPPACHSDDNEPLPADGETRTVTLSLNLPEAMTRSEVSDEEKPTRYLMQVIEDGEAWTVQDITGTQSATIDLYINQDYEFLIWADQGKDYYNADNGLQNIQTATGANESMGIAFRGSTTWSYGDATNIDLTLDFAVSKITLVNTTDELYYDNTISVTLEKAYTAISAKDGVLNQPDAYTYTKQITTTIAPGEKVATFYVLTKADEEQDITVLCNSTEIATVTTTPSPGKYLTLSGNIGGASDVPTVNATLNVSLGAWDDVAISLPSKLTDATVASTSLQGAGTADDPYLIQSAADLLYYAQDFFKYADDDTHFLLCTDIDITTNDWEPINIVRGTFDGNGHTIGGSWEKTVGDDGDNHFALFLQLPGTVCDLNVSTDITVSGESTARMLSAAGIAIDVQDGTVTGCTYSGTLTVKATLTGERSYMYIGGIAGIISGDSTISGCTFSGEIDATEATADTKEIGGIVGRDSGDTLTDNKETGTVYQ